MTFGKLWYYCKLRFLKKIMFTNMPILCRDKLD
jgi:hypothetical protein